MRRNQEQAVIYFFKVIHFGGCPSTFARSDAASHPRNHHSFLLL